MNRNKIIIISKIETASISGASRTGLRFKTTTSFCPEIMDFKVNLKKCPNQLGRHFQVSKIVTASISGDSKTRLRFTTAPGTRKYDCPPPPWSPAVLESAFTFYCQLLKLALCDAVSICAQNFPALVWWCDLQIEYATRLSTIRFPTIRVQLPPTIRFPALLFSCHKKRDTDMEPGRSIRYRLHPWLNGFLSVIKLTRI